MKRNLKERIDIKPESGKKIVFENGWKGVFSIGGKDSQKLSLWDLEVAGRRFTCTDKIRPEFVSFLAGIEANEIDVMFPYSSEFKMPPSGKQKGRKNKDQPAPEQPAESIDYNCTIRVPKQAVQPMFDDVMGRAEELVKLLVEIARDQWMENQKDKSCEI